jgi:hypothetical protein
MKVEFINGQYRKYNENVIDIDGWIGNKKKGGIKK